MEEKLVENGWRKKNFTILKGKKNSIPKKEKISIPKRGKNVANGKKYFFYSYKGIKN